MVTLWVRVSGDGIGECQREDGNKGDGRTHREIERDCITSDWGEERNERKWLEKKEGKNEGND